MTRLGFSRLRITIERFTRVFLTTMRSSNVDITEFARETGGFTGRSAIETGVETGQALSEIFIEIVAGRAGRDARSHLKVWVFALSITGDALRSERSTAS